MIYFVYPSYVPNTAAYNRALAYLKAFDRAGIKITVVFFLPDDKRSTIEYVFKYVRIEYAWSSFFVNSKFLRYFYYDFYLRRFRKRLKTGDKVYIYSANDILKYIISKKNVDIYFEITEHPEVHMSYSRLYKPTVNQHIELCKRVKSLFVISTGLRDYYIQKGVNPDSVHIINMIVDPSRFSIENSIKNNTRKYIAYCGTVSNNKDGVDILLKSFAEIHRAHPEIFLYIIGLMPSREDAAENLLLIEKLGIKQFVVFTGIISSERMPEVLKQAELLALARPDNQQARYGFPTKLGEYLLTGNPVVLTKVGDISLFLKDGWSAMIATPNDPFAFSEKCLWVLDHPFESKIIGARGKDVAINHFNADIESKKMIRIMNN